jgi:hypothetical protein
MKNKDTQQLGISVYIHAMKKQIEEEVKSKYLKRIEYLIGANNELMNELEQCEKGRGLSLEAYSKEKMAGGIR